MSLSNLELLVEKLRRRLIGLLLLPILSLIFIIGWTMYFIGDEKENNRILPKTITQTTKDTKTEEETIEVGLVEELVKENITKK
ncbi:MAG: hypothetical protein KGD70_15140 [Candidatus Lokiarchaeota archaeon]|nr:hypothetical protein [Candidatus Lokiarchaeota archaeon]